MEWLRVSGCLIVPVAPVAYQVILEPGIGQFREFGSPPSAYSYTFVGTFDCAQIDLRKARERELATLDEKSTSSGIAETLCAIKIEGKKKGRRDDICDHGLSRSWKVKVCKKKRKKKAPSKASPSKP